MGGAGGLADQPGAGPRTHDDDACLDSCCPSSADEWMERRERTLTTEQQQQGKALINPNGAGPEDS